jgi:hypothetical protein
MKMQEALKIKEQNPVEDRALRMAREIDSRHTGNPDSRSVPGKVRGPADRSVNAWRHPCQAHSSGSDSYVGAPGRFRRLGESYTRPPAFVPFDPAIAEQVGGAYQLPSGGRLVIQTARGRPQIGAEGQDAVTVLTGATEDQQKAWAGQSDKIKLALEGLLKGDYAAFDAVSGAGGRWFRDAIVMELRTLGKGKGDVTSIRVKPNPMGCSSAGISSPRTDSNSPWSGTLAE